MKYIYMLLLMSVFFTSCNEDKIDNKELCKSFIRVNVNQSFDDLFDKSISNIRLNSQYKKERYHYEFNIVDVFDHESDSFLTVHLYKKGTSLNDKRKTFEKNNQKVIEFISEKVNTENNSLQSYIRFVDSFYTSYYKIKVPEKYGFANVVFNGLPRSGRLISFILNNKSKVYYTDNFNTLNEYWKNKLKSIEKVDGNWFYEVKELDNTEN